MRYSAAYPTGAERRKSGKRGLTCFAHIAICDVPRTGWNKVMVEVGRFVEELKAAGVEFFAGVPDSLLKSFCAHVTDDYVVKM